VDADRFDGLARSLTRDVSRRGFLGILLASAVAIHPPAGSNIAWAKPGKGKAKGHSKGKAKGHGNSGGQGTGTGGSPTHGGSTNSSAVSPAPAAATAPLATECILPADTCDGCCQDGQCVPGTDHRSCGHSGRACQNCTAQAMVCTASRECGCNPESCAGCCAAGVCQRGDRNDACGRSGTMCHSCRAGYVCRQGVCCGEEGATTASPPPDLPYAAACCEGLLPDPAGICHRGCAGLGCADGESCAACHQSSGGVLDTCVEGRCCLTAGPCPCEAGDGPCAECCSGSCAQGQCRHDCSRLDCPDESECCPSSGECFSRDKTNCRRGDGSLIQCEAGFVCCQSPDGKVECGRNGRDGCPAGFVQALPATCREWVVQPGAGDGL
jgi:hypothetical protein